MALIGTQFRAMRGAIAGGALLIASAATGLVWLSIAAVGAANDIIGPAWAPVFVGLVLILPIAGFALNAWLQARRARLAPPPAIGSDDALRAVTAATQKMMDKSPFGALALAGLAGVVSVRFPSALTLLADVLNEHDRGRAAG
jgi:hypothetical protein